MNKIQMLDCTLRDGGYCNQWAFGTENIRKIVDGLVEAKVEIIECGFITNKVSYNPNVTKYTKIEQISNMIPSDHKDRLFVAMINYGEYDIESLPVYDGSSIDGIRLAYHKKDRYEALSLCEKIKEKGYKVFVQAMVSLSYNDDEFLETIRIINKIEPYAFYIVDSFGVMKSKDLIRLFYMIEHNLNDNIWIGFHAHNNMQLAYSNAQTIVNIQTSRNIIIDSSIYGMGRGAGNLNSELFLDYLNENIDKKYIIEPLLIIIDEILNEFYQRNRWGYSLPNYISSLHGAHPNYAAFLDDKKTLTIQSINEIFNIMDSNKKTSYDAEYIEKLYLRYMNLGETNDIHNVELKDRLCNKDVLLIAPGKSSFKQEERIENEINKNNLVVISVNFDYQGKSDYVFMSNLRRYREFELEKKSKCIVTSNIPADGVYFRTKYSELLNTEKFVEDNAGLMAIRFLMNFGVRKILLAGFDGYSYNSDENYLNDKMAFITKRTVLDAINEGMNKVLGDYSKHTDISFVTSPKYINV